MRNGSTLSRKASARPYGEGHFEIRLHGDGEERILEFHEEPIFDVFRNRVGQFCFCRDVTIERTFEHQIWISANTDADRIIQSPFLL